MKIAFIVDVFPSLSETFILDQITGLVDQGHEVEIFAGARSNDNQLHPEVGRYHLLEHTHYHNEAPENRFQRALKGLAIIFHNFLKHPRPILCSLNVFKYGRDAFALSLLYKTSLFLSRGKFDIIVCHFGTNGNLGALLNEIGIDGRLVTMFHGYDLRCGIDQGHQMFNRLFDRGDCFLSISSYTEKKLLLFGLNPKKIKYHPVGIHLDRFLFEKKAVNFNAKRPLKILSVARLTKEKGLFHGIRAVREVIKKNPDIPIKYNIIGYGPLYEELQNFVMEQGVENHVFFLGPKNRREIRDILKESDLFFLPSDAGGYSQRRIAEETGKSEGEISKLLSLQQLAPHSPVIYFGRGHQ